MGVGPIIGERLRNGWLTGPHLFDSSAEAAKGMEVGVKDHGPKKNNGHHPSNSSIGFEAEGTSRMPIDGKGNER